MTLSTTKLAQRWEIEQAALFAHLVESGFLYLDRSLHRYCLTESGQLAGGETRTVPDGNPYIVWDVERCSQVNGFVPIQPSAPPPGYLRASQLAESLELKSYEVNEVLYADLGWIHPAESEGWQVTAIGADYGGANCVSAEFRSHFVAWEPSILKNRVFLQAIATFKDQATLATKPLANASIVESVANPMIAQVDSSATIATVSEEKPISSDPESALDFRNRYEAPFTTDDGHRVRSRAEVMIDNWLYNHQIVHAYEPLIILEGKKLHPDFYLPGYNIYIEFWGLETENYQRSRQKRKKLTNETTSASSA